MRESELPHLYCTGLKIVATYLLQDDDSQSAAVQKELDDVKAEILETKEALDAAQRAGDAAEVDYLRKRVESLDKDRNMLREQQTVLLQGQASGQTARPAITWLACRHTRLRLVCHTMMNTAGMKRTLVARSCSQIISICKSRGHQLT